MKVKIVPEGSYGKAYGKIAVHSKQLNYSYTNQYIKQGQSNWNNVDNNYLKC